LDRLTIFVGPNGAGKRNIIDALAFARDCLADSIELAFKNRGGIQSVRTSSNGHPAKIGIGIDFVLPDGREANYAFTLSTRGHDSFEVAHEKCRISSPDPFRPFLFERKGDQIIHEIRNIHPKLQKDRLLLFAASGTEDFRPAYDFLTNMHFYSIMPRSLRELQEPDAGKYLKPDGSNAASILHKL